MTRANALQYVRARVGRSVVIGLMACLGVSLIAQGAAGPPLTNTDVIKLVAAKLSDAVIITAIQSAPRAAFDLSTNSLIVLKQSGVSDPVIAAMQKAMPANRLQPAAAPAAPIATPDPAGPPAAAATRAPAPEEPTEPYITFRVNADTDALIPLETLWTKEERSGNSYFSYLPGAASAVALPYGESLRFVIRMGGLKEPPKLEKWQSLNKLERLFVGEKVGRRYGTKEFVPMDVTPYGQVTSTVDKKNKTLYWVTLLYTSRQPLPPGEYAFSTMGLSVPAGFRSVRIQAFRIAR